MTNLPIHPSGQPNASNVTRPAGVGPEKARSGEREARVDGVNPSFQVLLERLQAKAAELEQTSKSLERPADLADAVADARASLEEAGSLGQRLLEAFRQEQTRAGGIASRTPQREDSE